DAEIIARAGEPLNRILPATEGIAAIIGTIRSNPEPNGRRLFNTAAVISDRRLLGYVDKTLLPEYDVFDDPRWFEPKKPGPRPVFEIAGRRV
ncbi:hypothetical protein OFN33_27920, partial [Escherichia coli]|nr:hypothetical protein [Escherichia coli]